MQYAKYVLPFLGLFPAMAFAAPSDFRELTELFLKILANVALLLFSLAVLGLLWSAVLYFVHSDDEKKREAIKPYLFWAIIGITVLFTFWGLVEILTQTIFGNGVFIPKLTPPA